MIKEIGIAVGISLISFGLQIWPRIKNRYFGIDTWRFALLADYIRKNKRLPDAIPEKYIIPGSVDNPPLLPLILSIFKKEWLDRNQGFISPAFDVLHSLTVFGMGYVATGNPIGGYIAQIIYALTPVVPLEASNLSLRTLSSLIFTWAMLAVISYAISPDPFHLVIAIAMIILLSYTHRMSVQVLFFAAIGFTIIEKNPAYLEMFLIGIAAAIFLFKGQYLKYLRGQLLMISFWMYNIQNRLAHQVRGNPSKKKKHTDFVRRIEYLIWKIPVFPFIAVNPWILYIFWALLVGFSSATVGGNDIWLSAMFKWSLVLFGLGILFNLKYLRFLGEGQRYLEYGVSAVSVVASSVILKSYAISASGFLSLAIPWILGIGCLGVIIFFQKRVVVDNPDKSITPALWAVIDFLNKYDKEVRIACIPHGLADAMAYFLENGKVLLSDNSIGVWELQDFWPLIKKPLKEIADKYNLNYFLISTNYVGLDEVKISGFVKAYERENYILLTRESA